MLKGLGASLACLCVLGVAHAEDTEGRFAAKGAGAASCTEFASAFEARDETAKDMLLWVAGYLTAANRFLPETYDIVSWQTDGLIATSLASWCERNPQARLYDAVGAMVEELSGDRVRERDETVRISVGERERELYVSVLRRVQERLAEEGYDVRQSGRFDAATRTAIRRYQGAVGLAATGFPDSLTLARLFGA